MQGLVTIDFGNSNPHAGLFQKTMGQWQLIKVVPWNEISLYLNQLNMTPDNTSLVLSEVRSREEELLPLLHQGFLLTRVKEYWRGERFAGMPVNYSKTLGEDRLIQAYLQFKKEQTPTLLIDAGTYVTMDVVTSTGFLGGYIIPGLKNYFSSFSQGEQLKDIELKPEFSSELPQNTFSAMAESYKAFAALAHELLVKHGIKKVLLTGGDSESWQQLLKLQKSDAEIKIEPHLIHNSLLYWLTTQIELT